MNDIRSSIFGRLALETNLVTEEQIEECLELQLRYEEQGQKIPRLGELLAAKKYLSIDQVKELLKQQKTAQKTERAPDPVKVATEMEEEAKEIADPSSSQRRTGGETFGNFQIIKRLGADSRGYTYKAKYLPKDLTVTLRVLSQQCMTEDPDFAKQFEEQAKQASDLKHPNIQRVVAAGRKHDRDFYAAEYIEGISLRRVLEARGKLDVPFALDVGLQIARALEYGHARGIYHQAICPSNILVTPERKVKLVAYGIAHDVIGDLKRLAAEAGDTPFYVAPENAIRKAKSDARTDIYSLGTVLYHGLTGEPPFKGRSLNEVLLSLTEEEVADPTLLSPEVTRQTADIVLSMMNPEPDHRYQSATHLIQDLEKAANAQNQIVGSGKTTGKRPIIANAASTLQAAAPAAGTRKRGDTNLRRKDEDQKKRSRAGREDPSVMPMIVGGVVLVAAIIFLAIYIGSGSHKRDTVEKPRETLYLLPDGTTTTVKPVVVPPPTKTPKTTTPKAAPKPAPKTTPKAPKPAPAEEPVPEPTPVKPKPGEENLGDPKDKPPLPSWMR